MRKPHIKAATRRAAILQLFRSGVTSPAEIARQVSCSEQNVRNTLRRHAPEYATSRMCALSIYLPAEQLAWLRSEAKSRGIGPGLMARAMMIGAIELLRDMPPAPATTDPETFAMSR